MLEAIETKGFEVDAVIEPTVPLVLIQTPSEKSVRIVVTLPEAASDPLSLEKKVASAASVPTSAKVPVVD